MTNSIQKLIAERTRRTDINNIITNNNITTSNDIISNKIFPDGNKSKEIETSSPEVAKAREVSDLVASLKASPSAQPKPEGQVLPFLRDKVNSAQESEMRVTSLVPEQWMGVKMDLFHNGDTDNGIAKLKAKICVIKHDRSRQELVANLNSPHRHLRRRVDEAAWRNDPHWLTVQDHLAKVNQFFKDVRASKIILPNNGAGTDNVLIAYRDEIGTWHFDIVRMGTVHCFILDDQPTPAQSARGCVATGYSGRRTKEYRFVSNEELGI